MNLVIKNPFITFMELLFDKSPQIVLVVDFSDFFFFKVGFDFVAEIFFVLRGGYEDGFEVEVGVGGL